MRKNPQPMEDKRRGAVAAELALITLLFLMPLSIGVVDFNMYLDARQILTNASNQALMSAARNEDPVPVVQAYAEQAGLDLDMLAVNVVREKDTVETGSRVTVQVNYELTDLLMVPWIKSLPYLKHIRVEAVGRSL